MKPMELKALVDRIDALAMSIFPNRLDILLFKILVADLTHLSAGPEQEEILAELQKIGNAAEEIATLTASVSGNTSGGES